MSVLTADAARKRSQPDKFGARPFFTPGRVETLREVLGPLDSAGLAHSADARVNYEWNQRVMARPLDALPLGPINPWHIDEHYGDQTDDNEAQLAIVNSDWEMAVDCALRYLVTGEDAAARASVRILQAWATIASFDTNSGSRLNWVDKWPMMIQAAMMVRDHSAYTGALHLNLQDVTRRGLALLTAFTNDDNWAGWGVCYMLAAGVFLEDRALFDTGIRRWRTVFDNAVRDDEPFREVYRQGSGTGDGSFGLWYSNFFLSAMTIAAEWARFGGEWLYDYAGADGSTFQGLVLKIRHWTRFPAEYPYNSSGTPSQTVRIMAHDDILHALWPDAESQWLLDHFPTGSTRDNFGMRMFVLAYRYRPLIG